jgi:hypothetical protein
MCLHQLLQRMLVPNAQQTKHSWVTETRLAASGRG